MTLPVNEIINQDCRLALADIEPETFNCCISSPPYWSLRDYGLEPAIWDGDEGCEHKWGDKRVIPTQDYWTSGGKIKRKIVQEEIANGQFCSLCGAWRGCLGLEPTPELFIKHLCDIYDLVWKVMRKDGTVWVNLADSYGTSSGAGRRQGYKQGTNRGSNYYEDTGKPGIKNLQKSLVGIPEMFVLEMQRRGWIRRSTIAWVKGLSFCENYSGNCMPDSAKDRPNKNGFEYIYFFIKSNDTSYWVNEKTGIVVGKQPAGTSGIEGEDWDWVDCPKCIGSGIIKEDIEAITKDGDEYIEQQIGEKCKRCKGKKRIKKSYWHGHDYWFEMQYEEAAYDGRHDTTLKPSKKYQQRNISLDQPQQMARQPMERWPNPLGRQFRNVWLINPQAFPEAHFATFPEKLVEICLKAGCPEFVCKKCGLPRTKTYQAKDIKRPRLNPKTEPCAERGRSPNDYGGKEVIDFQWSDCGCNAGWRSGLVLDMFRWFRDCRGSSCKNAA